MIQMVKCGETSGDKLRNGVCEQQHFKMSPEKKSVHVHKDYNRRTYPPKSQVDKTDPVLAQTRQELDLWKREREREFKAQVIL